ncbi:MAG: hypothetical protein ACM3PP_04780 [Candidatus Saccharibacteria bacterium]
MTRKTMIAFIVITIYLVLITFNAIHSNSTLEEKNRQSENANTRIDQLHEQVLLLKAQSREYGDSVDKLGLAISKTVTEEQLKAIAREGWQYELNVNNKKYTGSNPVRVDKGDVDIEIVERQVPYWPAELLKLGQLPLEDLKIRCSTPCTTSGRDGTVVQARIYHIKNLGKGQNVEITISSKLSNRIGLNHQKIILSR